MLDHHPQLKTQEIYKTLEEAHPLDFFFLWYLGLRSEARKISDILGGLLMLFVLINSLNDCKRNREFWKVIISSSGGAFF